MKQQLAIIGNGMATGRLLDDLIQRDGRSRFDITVFGEEPGGCYNRILLSRLLDGTSQQEIELKPRDWYEQNGIRLVSGQPVARLSPASRRLWTQDEKEHYFDVAVFATGSTVRLPTVEGMYSKPGVFKEGVVAFRTVRDCERMKEKIRPAGSAVVVGGGLLGLEAAKGLADAGMQVTLVHLYDTLMNTQLDPVGGAMLLKAVEKLGIFVRTCTTVQQAIGSKKIEAVQFNDGSKIPCDLLVFACGIKPRTDLAKDSDIPVNAGIMVGDNLATRIPGIYALGECAEHDGRTYGLVQPIWEQSAVLADILTGKNLQSRYRGSKLYSRLKVAGVEVASMGRTKPELASDEVLQIVEDRRSCYRKLIIRNDRLIGAQMVGDTQRAGALIRLFERGDLLPENRLDLFVSDEAGTPPTADIVCNCHSVSCTTIQNAISGGCRSLSDLAAKTKAGTGCGSCRGQLTSLLMKAPRSLELVTE
jgi:nitrite reductase (NADH) large subunit